MIILKADLIEPSIKDGTVRFQKIFKHPETCQRAHTVRRGLDKAHGSAVSAAQETHATQGHPKPCAVVKVVIIIS